MSGAPAASFWRPPQISINSRTWRSGNWPQDRYAPVDAGHSSFFGDYAPESMLIRVWMRTAVRREVTSFGTFLSTLCDGFCHHLDFKKFGFVDPWRTRGFYEGQACSITARGEGVERNYFGFL